MSENHSNSSAPTRAEKIAALRAIMATTPKSLWAAGILVLIEAFVLLFFTALTVADAFSAEARSVGFLLSMAAVLLITAYWIAFAARGLALQRRWARSSSIVWQLLQLSIASASFTGQFANPTIGVVIALPSVVVLVLLFLPSAVEATKDN